MIRAVFFSALVLGLVRPVGGVEPADDLAALRVLLVERLVIMEEVAAVKWIEGRSIDDEPREAKVLPMRSRRRACMASIAPLLRAS